MTQATVAAKKSTSPYAGAVGEKLVTEYSVSADNGDNYADRSKVVAAFAQTLGTSTKSVIAFLSRSGVYLKKEPVTKTGGKVVKKEELVTQLEGLVNMTEADAASMSKCNKTALVAILTRIRGLGNDIINLTEQLES